MTTSTSSVLVGQEFIFSGADLIALCSNPTVNTVETVTLASNICGTGNSDQFYAIFIVFETLVAGSAPGYLHTMGGPLCYFDSVTVPGAWNPMGPFNLSGGVLTTNINMTSGTISTLDPTTQVKVTVFGADASVTTTGPIGPTGPQGIQGIQGITGNTGATGAAASEKLYSNTTLRTNPICVSKSGTITSGSVVFNFTNDGTSAGTSLFPNGPDTNTVNVIFSDATSSYQSSWAWSNSNKTLTITSNKYTTANLLTGILGQTAANSVTCYCTVWGN